MSTSKITAFFKSITAKQWLVVGIIVVAIFLRFYNLRGSVMFQGDQGRDAIIVANIFLKKDPVFIGPVTSVGNMYLGPLYYYFMLPFLFVSFPNPMGPVYAVAFLGVITVYLMYRLGKKMIGENAAIFAMFLMAISQISVYYSRFSWNPNPAPLVSLVMIYFTYLAWKKNSKYWIGVAICFSILIQLHYLTLLSAGGAGIIWLLHLWESIKHKKKDNLKKLLLSTVIAALVFLVTLTPLMLFDLKHGRTNMNAFYEMIFRPENFSYSEKESVFTKALTTLQETEGRAMHILFEINIGKYRPLNKALVFSVLAVLIFRLLKRKKSKTYYGEVVIFAYFITGVIGTAFYQHTVFDHYIAYLFPVSFLIFGIVFNELNNKLWGKIILTAFVAYFIAFNIPRMPLKTNGWSLDDMKRTSERILEEIKPGEKYNIVLLSDSKDHYGQNYRYFLVASDRRPLELEEAGEAETLIIINEAKKIDRVVDDPTYEIVVFPNKKPNNFFEIEDGPEITILRK